LHRERNRGCALGSRAGVHSAEKIFEVIAEAGFCLTSRIEKIHHRPGNKDRGFVGGEVVPSEDLLKWPTWWKPTAVLGNFNPDFLTCRESGFSDDQKSKFAIEKKADCCRIS
jgi:hypothetical protein